MGEKQVQISERLFVDLVKYFTLEHPEPELQQSIQKGLAEKMEAIVRRELYTKYKTAPTPEQREAARKEYCERVGIPPSFRW